MLIVGRYFPTPLRYKIPFSDCNENCGLAKEFRPFRSCGIRSCNLPHGKASQIYNAQIRRVHRAAEIPPSNLANWVANKRIRPPIHFLPIFCTAYDAVD